MTKKLLLKTEQRSWLRATNKRIEDIKREKHSVESGTMQQKPIINKKSQELVKNRESLDYQSRIKRLQKDICKNDKNSIK